MAANWSVASTNIDTSLQWTHWSGMVWWLMCPECHTAHSLVLLQVWQTLQLSSNHATTLSGFSFWTNSTPHSLLESRSSHTTERKIDCFIVFQLKSQLCWASVWQHFLRLRTAEQRLTHFGVCVCASGDQLQLTSCETKSAVRSAGPSSTLKKFINSLTSTNLRRGLTLSPGIFGQMGNDLMPRIMEELLPDQCDVGAVEA